jgi:hypothetical protein
MYVCYARFLCTSCSAPEPGGLRLIALLLNAAHEQSANQPYVKQVDLLSLPLLESLASVYAFSSAVYALRLPC